MTKPKKKLSNKQVLEKRFSSNARRLARLANKKYTTIQLKGKNRTSLWSNGFNQANQKLELYPYMFMTDGADEYEFYFPYPPLEVQYSNFSDEIVQIPRPGTTPLVVFKSHRLKQIQFDFTVAIPMDGVSQDVEISLEILQEMSGRGDLDLYFQNMDYLFTKEKKLRNETNTIEGNRAAFKIQDMSFSAVQRNLLGKITFAKVSMTIVENHNPTITYVKIPPVGKPVSITKPKITTGKKGGGKYKPATASADQIAAGITTIRLDSLLYKNKR